MIFADNVIFGAGIFGLYFALKCAEKNKNVIVLEYDNEAFSRASYINQARIHNGYHYPRSYATAIKSASYFERFVEDFGFCVQKEFKNIYATSNSFSWVNKSQFSKFCDAVHISCAETDVSGYLKEGLCDGAFETTEYSFDGQLLKNYLIGELSKYPNCSIIYQAKTTAIRKNDSAYVIELSTGEEIESGFILNATYGSTNQILNLAGFPLLNLRYELCEIILCEVSAQMKNVGITVMDGPFFSLIPFGKTGLHSLSAVQYTPHKVSENLLPDFSCQEGTDCNANQLKNCNFCPKKPKTNWHYMNQLSKKFLRDDIDIKYHKSLFSVKALMNSSEIDDSRPTVIRKFSEKPYFYTVLSGKINTIYDLDDLVI
ncbi:MAG: NAD(P)/FAD-dependent oxidoreductase [Saprospiraceae bacterium]|nr:NAD(P)/FAD-dependent oxidoreductase [Saprospiraceae bacterium]